MKILKLGPSLYLFLSLSFSLISTKAQVNVDPFKLDDDDLNIGGDIFNDFNEDIDSAQIMEDERYYRYGRFFTVNLSLGLTTFDGNRGAAYENDDPSYGLSLTYFQDFRNAYGIGFEFSQHNFFLPDPVEFSQNLSDGGAGFVTVRMLRVFFSYRYYIETSDLGTAITYANPYFIGRLEYWYTTNKFEDQSDLLPNDKGGGLGVGLGGGLEFPIKIKESYLGVEFLWHRVNFYDKYTNNYQSIDSDGDGETDTLGYNDLVGDAWTIFTSYVINW